ncbi:RING finger protein 224-like [Mobula birostris]|uniref:RING finger protein 224-like n=1 Tax=Mobula birostris TaxID=1983395 RepID=UPI003B2846F5
MFCRKDLAEATHHKDTSHTTDGDLSGCIPTHHKNTECIICYSSYNLTDRLPRKLYCGHTFCQACLQRLDTMLNGQKWIPCPQCRQNTPCPRGGVVMLELDLGIFLVLKAETESVKTALRPDTDLQHKSKGQFGSQIITEQPAALCQDTPQEPHFSRSPCCTWCAGCCCG